ncbi:MAG: 50S ribosomal protein L11 methyltransferase [Gaiellaceae bacterium]
MLALFPEGFEEREEAGEVELAAYTDAAGEARLVNTFGPVATEPVSPGWEDGWRRFHRPVRVGPLWVGPPWEDADPDAVAVLIDPGRAFGTGAHATTRLCLDLLQMLEPCSLADLGSGSGVLAVAAAKLGFEPVLALDHDRAAVEAARANAAANGAAVDVRLCDVLADPLPETEAGLANLALGPVELLAARFLGRILVTSGYLAHERPEAPGWRHLERREAGGWAADLLAHEPS